MTDAQFEKIKKGLIFHSENGIDNLCTLTETALRELLDEVSKDKVVEHFEAYGQCRDSRRIAELEAQIEKMKCCGNCRFSESDKLNGTFCHREGCFVVASAKCKLWEN